MGKKWMLAIGLLLMVGLFFQTGSVRAGGWAVLSLSELPTEVVAERPFTIEFAMRQHGQTVLAGLQPTVRAVHAASGTEVTAQAMDMADEGVYTATLTLPQPGQWQWDIAAFTAVYAMPPLTVSEAVPVVASHGGTTAVGTTAVAWQLVLGWIAAAGAILLLFFWTQQRDRLRLAGAVLLGVVSLVSFGLYGPMPQPVLAENEATASVPAIATEAMGEALFVAKGCIQCHTNDNVTMAENMFPIGPNVTFVKHSPEYLQAWLANPAALKTGTQMPNLHLSQAEINTLVAFLQQD
jgi:mono/diheme cytochrome c family protein